MIPYFRFKRFDFYTLSQTKLLENHIFHSGTKPIYPIYSSAPPPLPGG